MSIQGGPHKGPAKLSEGMVAIEPPPPAPASDYASPAYPRPSARNIDLIENFESSLEAVHLPRWALAESWKPGDPAPTVPALAFDFDAIDLDEQAWLRAQSAADKASGNDAPIDRDALRQSGREAVARRLANASKRGNR